MKCCRCPRKTPSDQLAAFALGWAVLQLGGHMCAPCYQKLQAVRQRVSDYERNQMAKFMKGKK